MNLVVQSGRLVSRPDKRYTVNNKPVVNFCIAVKKRKKSQDGKDADFFYCTAWDVHAENIFKYFDQGDVIMVKGRLENDNYTDREGNKVYGTVIVVDEWEFGPKKKSNSYEGNMGSYGVTGTISDADYGGGFPNYGGYHG